MNTCGTCKHFGKPVEDEDRNVPVGYHICTLITMRDRHIDPPGDETAVVVDGSGYYAALCIKEEFGCNQWTGADSATHA